jgi:hypothetical protein
MLRRRTLSCGKGLTFGYTSNRPPQAAQNLSLLNRSLFAAQTFAIVRAPRFHCVRLLAHQFLPGCSDAAVSALGFSIYYIITLYLCILALSVLW